MFIEELTVRGYGRLKDFRIESAKGLNCIYGANETGKSSVGNCLRDLLLGPGRWDDEVQGPRAPEARPWDGGMFQARVRYVLEDGTSYTVQRDFEAGTIRARDNNAQAEVPLDDPGGPAPGARPPEPLALGAASPEAAPPVDDEARLTLDSLTLAERDVRQKIEETAARLTPLQEEASRHEYVFRKSQMLGYTERLDQARNHERALASLRPRLLAVERFANMNTDSRDVVVRNQQRLESLDAEMGDIRKNLESLQEVRKSVGQKLTIYERFFTISQKEIETIKALNLAEGLWPAALEEKQRNIEGFRVKDADISARLAGIGDRFVDFKSDEEFESRIGGLEKEIARTEVLFSRVSDLKENEKKIAERAVTARRFLGWTAIMALLTGVLAWVAMETNPLIWWVVGLTVCMTGGCLYLKVREDRAAAEVTLASERIGGEVERMRGTVDKARDEMRGIFDKCRVTTIKDLRTAYREYRALQRDLATVRAYIWNLEREIEAGRAREDQSAQTPRVLVECGVISEWEPVTPRAISDFLEKLRTFQAIHEEEDGLKRRIHELMRDLDEKREEEERLKVRQSAALREMGLTSIAELEWALTGRAEFEKLSAQATELDEKVLAAMRGATREQAQNRIHDALAVVRKFEQAGEVTDRRVDPGRMDEYELRTQQAQDVVGRVKSELAALEGQLEQIRQRMRPLEPPAAGAATVAGDLVTRTVHHLEQAYETITQQPITLRLIEEKGNPVLQVKRPGAALDTWMAPIALGRSASDLLHGLLLVERAVSFGSTLPLIMENPFTRLDVERRGRALEWLLELSRGRQIFFFTSQEESRDALRTIMQASGRRYTETIEGEFEILGASAAP